MSKGFLCRGPVYSDLTGPGISGRSMVFDSDEDEFRIAHIAQIVDQEFSRTEGVVAGHAGLVGDAPRRAVRRVLLALAGGEHRPEIVEHVFVRRQAFARKKPDLPDLD